MIIVNIITTKNIMLLLELLCSHFDDDDSYNHYSNQKIE